MFKRLFYLLLLIAAFFLIPQSNPVIGNADADEITYRLMRKSVYHTEFVDASYGWVCGIGGNLFHTINGGLTWEKQETNTYDSIFSMSFVDKKKGWAVGQDGMILTTDNGGDNWTTQTAPENKSWMKVDFFDKNIGIVVGDWGKIIGTKDGGKTCVDISLKEDVVLYDVKYLSEKELWIAGELGKLYHSIDGGITWDRIVLEDDFYGPTMFAISFTSDGQHGICGGLQGMVFVTHDSGKTWTKQTVSEDSVFNLELTDNGTGFAVGNNGGFYKIEDNGDKWTKMKPPGYLRAAWFQCLSRLDDDSYIVAGTRGSILFFENYKIVQKK